MHSRLAALEERALAADRRRSAAAAATAASAGEVAARKAEVRQLVETNEHLKAALGGEAEWARREGRTVLLATPVGRVTWEVRCRSSIAAAGRLWLDFVPLAVHASCSLRLEGRCQV